MGTSSSSREDPVESQEQEPNSNTSSEYLDLDLSELNANSTGVMKQKIKLPAVGGFLLY